MKNWIKKNKYWLLLVAFILCVFIYTVFGRSERISDNRLDLFWSYREAFVNGNKILLWEDILNIFMLAPAGFILACALESKCCNKLKVLFSLTLGIVTSGLIEIGQYYLFRGTAELDDIFNNTIGTVAGCILYIVLSKIKINNKGINVVSLPIAVCCVFIAIVACVVTDNTSDGAVGQLGFQVTNSSIADGKLDLNGFCFTYGYDLMDIEAKPINVVWNDKDYEILLKSKRTGIVYPMEEKINIPKPAVNKYFKSKYEYPKTGFTASININKINLDDEYEILLKSGRLTLSGKTYIKDGEIEKTPESENVQLDVNGTYLQNIVKKGYLKAHNKDNSCVIYQYGKYLFWITDDDYKFDNNGATYVEYQIWTTQLDRVEGNNTKYWDDQGFIFEEEEITNRINSGKYRVAMKKLSMNYSIAYICTGSYKDGMWLWQEKFRPRY